MQVMINRCKRVVTEAGKIFIAQCYGGAVYGEYACVCPKGESKKNKADKQ